MADDLQRKRKSEELYSPEFTERIYRFIKDYWRTTGKTPSFRTIGQYLSFNSTTCIYFHLRRLQKDGRVLDTDPIVIDAQKVPQAPPDREQMRSHAPSPLYIKAKS